MQVWNMLHAACWKYRTQKITKICHLGTIAKLCRATCSQLRHVSTIGKTCSTSIFPPFVLTIWWTSAHYGWHPLASLRHLSKFQRVSRLGSVTARHSTSGRQQNFAALNRGRYPYSAGRPSRLALAHILVVTYLVLFIQCEPKSVWL